MSADLALKCLLPKLLDSVFLEYEEKISTVGVLSNPGQLLIKLHALIGKEIVEKALHLLDNWIITIYIQGGNNEFSFAEFSSGTSSLQFVRIIPDVNYCVCSFFQRFVLQLPPKEFEDLTPTLSSESNRANSSEPSYICEHILALRLARILQPKRLRQETLPYEEFLYLYNNLFKD